MPMGIVPDTSLKKLQQRAQREGPFYFLFFLFSIFVLEINNREGKIVFCVIKYSP